MTRLRRVLPAVCVIVACWPLLTSGLTGGHDWPFGHVRIAEYMHALDGDGPWPPAWAPNLAQGYGSPFFLLYSQVFLATASLFARVGGVTWGAGTALIVFSGVSALGAMTLVRVVGRAVATDGARPPVEAARLAACLYATAPYLLCDKLYRSAYAEFAALSLLPFALAGVVWVARSPLAGYLLLSAGVCAVTLSHNLTALVCMALIGLTAAVFWPALREPKRLGALVAGVATGLLTSVWYWLPALTLKGLTRLSEVTQGDLHYANNFPPPATIVLGEYYSLGPLFAVVLVWGVLDLLRGRYRTEAAKRLAIGLVSGSLVLLGLVTPLSAPVWEWVPWLPLFQFPWRLLGPTSLLLSVLGALVFWNHVAGEPRRARARYELLAVGFCVLAAWPSVHSAPRPVRSEQPNDAWISAEQIRENDLQASVGDVFWPAGATLDRSGSGPFVQPPPGVTVELASATATSIEARVRADRVATLAARRHWFPGWEATVGGETRPVSRTDEGLVGVSVPAGEHTLSLRYRGPASRRYGLLASGLGVLIWALGLGVWVRRRSAPR